MGLGGTDPTAAPDPPPPSGAASLRASRPSGHEAAGRDWRDQTERHRALVGEPCPRCGACSVVLERSGYVCAACRWRPSLLVTKKGIEDDL